MQMPKADKDAEALLLALLPDDPRVAVKTTFGQKAAYVNSKMFAGAFGRDIFVRLPEAERSALLKEKGALPFAPMKGRPLKEYVVFPASWRADPERIRPWLSKACDWVGATKA